MAKRRRDRTSVELTSTAGAASASAARARTTRLPRAVDLFVARGRAVTEKAHEVEAMTRAIVPQLQGQVWTRFFRERGRGVARAAREGDGRGRQRERALVILKAEVLLHYITDKMIDDERRRDRIARRITRRRVRAPTCPR
jgi:hypothetical protein